jgi:hypothetical protein
MKAESRPCLCGCGRMFIRPKSMPLCTAATARAWELCRAIPLRDEFNAVSRRNHRFWSSEATVAAALAADREAA